MTAGDYLSRLAVALPLVLLLIGGLWFTARRGWLKPAGASGGAAVLRPVATLATAPGARLVVIEFDGRHLLLAASRAGTTLLDVGRRP